MKFVLYVVQDEEGEIINRLRVGVNGDDPYESLCNLFGWANVTEREQGLYFISMGNYVRYLKEETWPR